MANFDITAVLGSNSASFSIAPTNARMTEFLEDLRDLSYQNPSMTLQEVADRWLLELGQGQVEFARALKQQRLNAGVAQADDLTGTV